MGPHWHSAGVRFGGCTLIACCSGVTGSDEIAVTLRTTRWSSATDNRLRSGSIAAWAKLRLKMVAELGYEVETCPVGVTWSAPAGGVSRAAAS